MECTVHCNMPIGENTKFRRGAGLDELLYLTHEKSGQALLDRAYNKGTLRYARNHYTFSSCIILCG